MNRATKPAGNYTAQQDEADRYVLQNYLAEYSRRLDSHLASLDAAEKATRRGKGRSRAAARRRAARAKRTLVFFGS